ncbi:sphingomyelin phosphodiesterase 1-like [Anticarsia gemmatalis]|uniref:sphingomyelin phosphodiesterase 1-like n=1 Tax=Anticarsia gemmatalis TaxID=129554 RepID=UPI003F771901
MRVLIFTITLLASSFATQLLSSDDVEALFIKYMKNELTETETQQFQDLIEILHRPEYGSTKSVDNASQARTSIDCLVCRSAFATVFSGVQDGQSDEEIIQVVTNLCINMGIESQIVCEGVVALNVPIITYIIRNEPKATPRAFCGLVMQRVGDPNNCRIDDPRFEWQVDLPPPSTISNTPTANTKPLKIALITDAHIDPLYEAGGVAECGEPTCCRKGQTLAQNYIYRSEFSESIVEQGIVNASGKLMLDLSVASKLRQLKRSTQTRFPATRSPAPAGYWGDFRNCDTPIWAFDDVIDRITETHKDIDVVYYIGDTIDHGVWETSYELIDEMNRYLIEKIRKGFGDNVLVVPNIGNHESQPTNQFAPSRITGDKLNTTWLYDALAEKWDHYLSEEAKKTLRERGDFSLLVRPGLRVISLNNNVAYRYNWWLVYDPLDAKKHLDWLIDELHKAEQAGEKVHILAHIPPGVHDLTQTWTREYNRIVNRFTATIAAEFNGHTHSDEFKIFYNPEGNPIEMAWGAGSTTSYTFYNLNYKIVDVNTATYEPENIGNYIYNLTEANLTPNRKPHWFQLYDMKNTYSLTNLSATSMNELVHKMVTTNKELLDIYAAFYSKISDRWSWCNDGCKIDNLCKTVVTVLWEREKCEELRKLFSP